MNECYLLAAIERYVTWPRVNGRLLDRWMRLHERLGARVATALPRRMRITGPCKRGRLGSTFRFPPESGDYVFPYGLAPLTVECDGDTCTYWEPKVWMIHPECVTSAAVDA